MRIVTRVLSQAARRGRHWLHSGANPSSSHHPTGERGCAALLFRLPTQIMLESGADPTSFSLLRQRELIRSGEITSVELTSRAIERIRRLNPELNIVIRPYFEDALKRARALDAQPTKTGALHGVPFTIKDAFRIKGIGTSYGGPGLELLKATENCTVVERILSAGAVLLGQTNVPFSCFDWQTGCTA